MKYSFLLPYHNRLPQFQNTLDSWVRLYGERRDVELVVVVDGKSTHEFGEVLLMLSDSGLTHKVLLGEAHCNPAPHYNMAAQHAVGSNFILTSPEVTHTGSVLDVVDEVFGTFLDCYVVMGCRSVGRNGTQENWFQHSTHRPANYHFCSILPSRLWNRVGGFDEQFAEGVAYDDDDFLASIHKAGVPLIHMDAPATLHQWHPKVLNAERRQLVARNKKLYDQKWKGCA